MTHLLSEEKICGNCNLDCSSGNIVRDYIKASEMEERDFLEMSCALGYSAACTDLHYKNK